MNPFSRLFGYKRDSVDPVNQPDDSHITETLLRAKKENTTAATTFVVEARKQERDAQFARKIISDVINRADKLKAIENAGIQK